MPDVTHIPLHLLVKNEPILTAGRIEHHTLKSYLCNAHARIELDSESLPESFMTECPDGTLLKVQGHWNGELLSATHWTVIKKALSENAHLKTSLQKRPRELSLGDAITLRARANEIIRQFFATRDFLEVETPAWVAAPGTDIYLAPFEASFQADGHTESLQGYLHTSPEFAMKRLLCEGFERIYQLTHVWRNGEVTPYHNPEFTILEWYRAWEPVEAIMDDVEQLTREILQYPDDRPFLHLTMQEVFLKACGFDLLNALTTESLQQACLTHQLLRADRIKASRWDELFFELVVTYVDPMLEQLGAVFVTDWPTPLAVLARKKPDDPRVAERFELYIDGVELANGFGELTDPVEQRARFEEDLRHRKELGLPPLPLPDHFLQALEYGMPEASGVAMGVDRLLMLAANTTSIHEIMPFALERDANTGKIQWR